MDIEYTQAEALGANHLDQVGGIGIRDRVEGQRSHRFNRAPNQRALLIITSTTIATHTALQLELHGHRSALIANA
ncbi:hypothetical protein A2T76_13560 [Pseudomonas brenneri]|nr:hypothetical protein A2T76_13560 [Pseudomonas brenneri]